MSQPENLEKTEEHFVNPDLVEKIASFVRSPNSGGNPAARLQPPVECVLEDFLPSIHSDPWLTKSRIAGLARLAVQVKKGEGLNKLKRGMLLILKI